jgi:hypothetical protein
MHRQQQDLILFPQQNQAATEEGSVSQVKGLGAVVLGQVLGVSFAVVFGQRTEIQQEKAGQWARVNVLHGLVVMGGEGGAQVLMALRDLLQSLLQGNTVQWAA